MKNFEKQLLFAARDTNRYLEKFFSKKKNILI